jgi:quercetin dioxygenase-like cupin family protein
MGNSNASEAAGRPAMESTFLGGKVLKRTLPVIQGVPSGETVRVKRLLLPQGELAQVFDGPEGMQYLALVELRAGATRGNHYHKVKQEWLYIFQGEVVLTVAELDSPAREQIPLRAGDLAFIPAGTAHAIRTVHPGQALEFAVARFDAADVYPFRLD